MKKCIAILFISVFIFTACGHASDKTDEENMKSLGNSNAAYQTMVVRELQRIRQELERLNNNIEKAEKRVMEQKQTKPGEKE